MRPIALRRRRSDGTECVSSLPLSHPSSRLFGAFYTSLVPPASAILAQTICYMIASCTQLAIKTDMNMPLAS
ncbi:hypothetical protein LX32DRAFT_97295 [Colletotrichum zoysiae]|uniref:Uncharacterized protein n=1 Tax=Colletotrichum zoysiae TaxID=1216348 RepID=A0AAD9HA03_9PEZI|nr:hypothetical protein LX32DRAFT_97295 [Colletotrichum zoysiae]